MALSAVLLPARAGELQLADAIALLISEGHPVHVVVHDGIRHDLGNPAGFIPASVEFWSPPPEVRTGIGP